MTFSLQELSGNQLLAAMPSADLLQLMPHFEWIEHRALDVFSEPHQPMEYGYFPVSGQISVVATISRENLVEAGLVGMEGMAGCPIVLRAGRGPHRLMSQADGRALRIPAAQLLDAIDSLPAVQDVLLRFIHTFMVQTASTLLVNASYTIEERLARWTLMCQDRLEQPALPMTHQFMSLMLAVRRSSVTEALHALESRHLIHTTRGFVHVKDRLGLVLLAADSYGEAENEHRRLILPAARP